MTSHSTRFPGCPPFTHRHTTGGATGYSRVVIFLALFISLAGCGKISFLGSRYDNFTAYYNTFYNATRAYESGTKALERPDEQIDRNEYLSIFTSTRQASNSEDFENTILKSADVLRKHPNSKWVDDALLLIGKSYFYQQNYVGAEQKFNEVIDLGSALEDEARFWLARNLIASSRYDEASEHLELSLNREGLNERWQPMLRLALGELYVERQDWEEAANQLSDGVDGVRDRDIGARGQYLLGQVLETMGRYEEAVEAYEKVQRFKPLYELSYAAQWSAIRVTGLHLDAEEALRELRRMDRDDKNYNYRFELAYLRARVFQDDGRFDDAYIIYDDLLYYEEGNTSAVRGRIHYALGELYRDAYQDFVLAAAHFDTAKTAIRTPATGVSRGSSTSSSTQQTVYTPEAITDAEDQSDIFGSFVEVHDEIANMDSLLYLGQLDEEAFIQAIHEFRVQLAEEMAEQQRLLEEQQSLQRFQSAANTGTSNRTTGASSTQTNTAAGFLFHKDPVRVQEGRDNFKTRWGDRPLVPNWRRMDAVSNMDVEALAEIENGNAVEGEGDAGMAEDELPLIDYSDVPRDSVRQVEMRQERSMARYQMANVLFLSMNRPDSAASWYRLVIDEDGDHPVAQRAYYALAELQRSLGDTLSSRRLYEQVLADFPDSDFANRVREQLGLETITVSDSLVMATEAYDEAYDVWQGESYEKALNDLITVAVDYPTTDIAPRALLAAGTVFMEWASRDSLDVFEPLPLSIPDSVLIDSELFETKEIRLTPELETIEITPVSTDSSIVRPDSTATDSLHVADFPAPDSLYNITTNPDADSLAAADVILDSLHVEAGLEAEAADSSDTYLEITPSPTDTLETARDLRVSDDNDRPLNREDLALDRSVVDDGTGGENVNDSAGESDAQAVTAFPDSLAENDTSLVQPDDTIAGGDADSLAVVSDTLSVDEAGDPVVTIELGPIYLKSLYSSITTHYTRTPYADQAGTMISTLDELLAEINAVADSLAQLSDSLLAAPDSVWMVSDSMFVAQDSMWVASDSMLVASDPMWVMSDSMWVASDSMWVASDSMLVASDSMWVASDSMLVASDSVWVATDSMLVALAVTEQDSLLQTGEQGAIVPSDSLAIAEAVESPQGQDEVLDETVLMEGLEGEDAALRRRNMPVHQPQDVPPDSSQTEAGEALPLGMTGQRRPPGEEGQQRPYMPPGRPGAAGEPASPILGSEPVHPEQGGWALSMNHGADCQNANQMVMGMGYQGFRCALITYPVGGDQWCRVVIGQFETKEEAQAALEEFGLRLPSSLEIFEMKTDEEE